MFITARTAYDILKDLTSHADLPLVPEELMRSPRFQQHGHVFFGDLALRRYKRKNLRGFEDRDVYAVGKLLRDIVVARDDVVEVHLPPTARGRPSVC